MLIVLGVGAVVAGLWWASGLVGGGKPEPRQQPGSTGQTGAIPVTRGGGTEAPRERATGADIPPAVTAPMMNATTAASTRPMMATTPPQAATNAPTAASGPAKSVADLRVGEVRLMRAKGARGVVQFRALGSLTNTSSVQRFGVRLELGLLNAQGAQIDTTSEYCASIGPREVWNFNAPVPNPLAASAKVLKIAEDN